MGRGRQKAKHTKVARELKYFSPDTNYNALERELTSSEPGAAFTDPKVKESMAKQGNTIRLMPPAETARFFRSELAKYATIVKNAGMDRI